MTRQVNLNANIYEDSVSPQAKLALPWQAVKQAAECYPQYERESLFIIKNFLGYVPNPLIYIPHQPFLKSLSAAFYRATLNEEQLIKELEFHCKRIRNDDMKKHGWAVNRRYNDADYERYETHLSAYKNQARERFCEGLGTEPSLEYSLGAEVYLRQLFQSDGYYPDMPDTVFDMRAVAIASYRQYILDCGPEAADESVLYGQYLCDFVGISPYTRFKL